MRVKKERAEPDEELEPPGPAGSVDVLAALCRWAPFARLPPPERPSTRSLARDERRNVRAEPVTRACLLECGPSALRLVGARPGRGYERPRLMLAAGRAGRRCDHQRHQRWIR